MFNFIKKVRKNNWYMWYRHYWMFQFCLGGWISFGIHIDWTRRYVYGKKTRENAYGPYIDIHFLCCILSLGYYPVRSTTYPIYGSVGRGGEIEWP